MRLPFSRLRASFRTPSLLNASAICAVLLVFAGLVTSTFSRVGVTFDELGHIVSGYGYWKFDDFRVNAENGVLATRVSAVPLLPPTKLSARPSFSFV